MGNEYPPDTLETDIVTIMAHRHFTEKEDQYIMDNYPHMSTEKVAKTLNRCLSSVYQRAYRLDLRKSEEYTKQLLAQTSKNLSESGKRHRFGKGHTPVNKGKSWSEFMPEESQKGSRNTCFKKGHTPKNTLPDYEIVVRQRTDRNEPPYKWIKVPGHEKLLMLNRYIWEQANGHIPKAHNIVFKDGDTMNCDISNLAMVSNADLLRKNSLHRFPKEVQRLIQAKGALTRQINKQSKNQ